MNSNAELLEQSKDLIDRALQHYGKIYLPDAVGPTNTEGFVNTIKTLQNAAVIQFDSANRVSRDGSIVDFVIKKGSQELLIGVWPMGYKLTDAQCAQIDKAGRSYIAILGEWIERSNIASAIGSGVIPSTENALGGQACIPTSYWVYHARHGWIYDKENKEVRG